MWRQCLATVVGDTWWGLYRFHRFSKSALYPPVAPPVLIGLEVRPAWRARLSR